MKLQRLLILLMIVVEAATLNRMYKVALFPALALALAALGFTGRIRFALGRVRQALLSLGIVLFFFVMWRLFPFERSGVIGALGYRVTYVFAQYFMVLQLLELYLTRKPGGDGTVAPALYGMLALTCAGNVFASSGQVTVYILACVLFTGLLAAYFTGSVRTVGRALSPAPRAKGIWLVSLLVVVLLGAGGMAASLYSSRYYLSRVLLRAFLPRLPVHAAGFSEKTKLGDVARLKYSDRENQTALRVFAGDAPGYLRGKAFSDYAGSEWEATTQKTTLSPTDPPPEDLPPPGRNRNYFALRPARAGTWRSVDVWPDPALTEGMFAPIDAAVMRAPVGKLELDENGITDSGELIDGINYTSYTGEATAPDVPSGELKARLTRLPNKRDRRIYRLAERVFDGCTTSREKIAAVVTYFHNHYEYGTRIRVPSGVDPLTHFLLERPPAHCEYFAAGAAFLLRASGVPARYVTGFVVEEWNPFGNYWMARNRNAHAWVEAYDDTAGWVVVEATPGSGVPASGVTRSADYLRDYLSFRLQELSAATRLNGLRGLLAWLGGRAKGLWEAFLSADRWTLALKFAFLVLLLLVLRRRIKRPRRRATPVDPRVRKLHGLLAAMDKSLRRHGLVRREGETLHQFSRRIAERGTATAVSAWYVDYAAVRYGGALCDEDIERLRPSRSNTATL